MLFRMQNSMQIMILPSNMIQLNGIDKLWTFEVEASKWPKRHEHTLSRCYFRVKITTNFNQVACHFLRKTILQREEIFHCHFSKMDRVLIALKWLVSSFIDVCLFFLSSIYIEELEQTRQFSQCVSHVHGLLPRHQTSFSFSFTSLLL